MQGTKCDKSHGPEATNPRYHSETDYGSLPRRGLPPFVEPRALGSLSPIGNLGRCLYRTGDIGWPGGKGHRSNAGSNDLCELGAVASTWATKPKRAAHLSGQRG